MPLSAAEIAGTEPPDTIDGIHLKADLASPGYRVVPNPSFLKSHPQNLSLYLTPSQASALADSLGPDGALSAVAREACASVEEQIRSGSLGKVPTQYLFWLAGVIESFANAYVVSGDAKVGAFLKYLVLDTARRPCAYYTDRLIRAFKAEDPVGDLETSSLTEAMAKAAWFGRDLWSEGEWAEIQGALRDKLLLMNLNKLRVLPGNNYRAVIGLGATLAAKAVGDTAAFEKSLGITVSFATDLLEKDGSSSEQVDYFFFPVSKVVSALMLLPIDAMKASAAKTPLGGSVPWLVSHFYYAPNYSVCDKIKINFGDSDFGAKRGSTNAGTGVGWVEERLSLHFLSLCYGQREALWLIEQFEPTLPKNLPEAILYAKFPGASWQSSIPTAPLASAFESGVATFRSAWRSDGFVMAIRGGAGGRTNYSHDRANRGAITLFAWGEPLIMTPGRFSYRNPLHKELAYAPESHSLVTLRGQRQFEKPVSSFGKMEDDGQRATVLLDLKGAHPEVRAMTRRIFFHRTLGFSLVADRVDLEKEDAIDVRFLLNNLDGALKVKESSERHFFASRPRASLQIISTLEGTDESVEPAYVNTTYSYAIGDPGEGKMGSGQMVIFWGRPSTRHESLTLLLPCRAGEGPIAVARSQGTLRFTVKGVVVTAQCLRTSESEVLLNLTEETEGRTGFTVKYLLQ